MKYFRAKDLDAAIQLMVAYPDFLLMCGSTDVAVALKNQKSVTGLIDISTLNELRYIKRVSNSMVIGALSTISDILESSEVRSELPLLIAAGERFASHQIRNLATLGGNIANASPAADLIAPLLALNASVTLASLKGRRSIKLEDLFCGYKCTTLDHELILEITIPLREHQWYYRKTGARERLNITKVSLSMIKNSEGYAVSGTSLNPYTSRFRKLEVLLNSGDFSDEDIIKALEEDIDPSGSLRSTEAYRRRVAFNMIKEALYGLELP